MWEIETEAYEAFTKCTFTFADTLILGISSFSLELSVIPKISKPKRVGYRKRLPKSGYSLESVVCGSTGIKLPISHKD